MSAAAALNTAALTAVAAPAPAWGGAPAADTARALSAPPVAVPFGGVPSVDALLDAAASAKELATLSDVGAAPGGGPLPGAARSIRVGAALLARSGRIHTGCAVGVLPSGGGAVVRDAADVLLGGGKPVSAGPLGAGAAGGIVPAEQVALMKALSEGDTEFAALVLMADTRGPAYRPAAASAAMLAAYGDFPVYSATVDRVLTPLTLAELTGVPAAGRGPAPSSAPAAAAPSDAGGEASDTFAADVPLARWGVAHVGAWLDRCCGLAQYQHKFREAAIDGVMLLSLHDTDLHHLLGVAHPLHRRKISIGIARLAARGTYALRRRRMRERARVAAHAHTPSLLCLQTRASVAWRRRLRRPPWAPRCRRRRQAM